MSRGHVASRHRLLLILLWLHVLLLAGLGFVAGEPLMSVGLASLLLIVYAIAGILLPTPVGASTAVAFGLVTASLIFRAFAPEISIASLHYLAMIGAISLYRMWQPLLVAVVATTGYEFYGALVTPGGEQLETAAIESGFALLLALILAAGWRQPFPESQETLASSRFRIAFDQAPLGMAIVEPSGEFIQVNGAMGRLLGYAPPEMVGRSVRSIVHPDDMAEVREAWEQMDNGDGHHVVFWLRCLTATGSSLWGRASLSLVRNTSDHQPMVILQIDDASRSDQKWRELEELLVGKDEYVAAVGEEMGGPISSLIDLTTDDDPRLRPIRIQAQRVASIVEDLVVSARAGNRSRPIASLPIDAETLCHDVVAAVAGTEAVDIDVEATDIWADPGLTRQILTGLVGNAVRFGGSRVEVRTRGSGPDTVIEVIDNGAEISETDRERIFDSDLQRGRPLTKPATVGLGLTVGRRLARQMDGDLTYRRNLSGENVFELRLPSEQFTSGSRPADLDLSA